MFKRFQAIAVCALLAIECLVSCGGSAHAKPINVCMQPTDRIIAMAGCDAIMQSTAEPDPVKSVAAQAALGANVILWIGRDRDTAIANYVALINEAKKYSNIKWVYVADEIDLCPTGPCPGRDGELVHKGTQIAHAAGLQTIATITPSVIMLPGFALPDVDHISIDVYPSTRDPATNLGGCSFSGNPSEDQFFCASQKLRRLGFTGMVGYVWQGFGLTTDTDASRTAYLLMQRIAIRDASAMGADAVMNWGCYLGPDYLEREPTLVPLCGTQYEWLVTP